MKFLIDGLLYRFSPGFALFLPFYLIFFGLFSLFKKFFIERRSSDE